MNKFRYWKNPAQVPELEKSSFEGLSRFPSLSFLDSVQVEEAGPLAGNMDPVSQALATASPAMSPLQGSNHGVRGSPSVTTRTPGRVPSRRQPLTHGVPPIRWKVVDPDTDAEEGNSSEAPMADKEEDAEYDRDPDSSSHSEGGKENSSPSPTRSAEFSKVLSLKPKKKRIQGSRKVETPYGRLPRGEQDIVNKARIKEMVAQHETHKAKVKKDIPTAKEAKRAAEGKVGLETPRKAAAAEDKVWQCNVCLKMFGLKSTLKQHSRIHLDSNNHACSTCDKTFRSAEKLAAHQRTHLGQNPYICITCGKTFLIKGNFDKHCSTVHGGPKAPKPYACTLCSASYTNKGTLSRHLKMKHANEPEVPKPLDITVME